MGRWVLQETESLFSTRPGTENDRFELGYWQLWLYVMQHYPELPAETKKTKKELLAKAGSTTADEVILHEFVALADRLGFKSSRINELRKRSPDREIVRTALLRAQRPGQYTYNDTFFEVYIEEVMKVFSRARPALSEKASPSLVSEDFAASGNRCGFPDQKCHEDDCRYLFIANLYRSGEGQADGITSFFVRRSVYFAFFGRSASVNWDDISDTPRLHDTHEDAM